MATIRDMCIRVMDTTASAITGEADDMFGRRTTEVGMDMAGTGGTAVRIASWLTARVVSPTMTSSNGGGRSSERRGSSPQVSICDVVERAHARHWTEGLHEIANFGSYAISKDPRPFDRGWKN
jgi:hypothetical protein